jgi:WD40 repeat protein
VAFDGEGRRIVSVSGDETVRAWDVESGTELACLRGHESCVICVAFDRAGRRIVSGSMDKTVRVWDVVSGAELACLRGHEGGVASVSFDRAGRRIVSGSHDRTVRVWDAESGAELACLRGDQFPVASVSFDDAGRRVVSKAWDATRVWDAESGACLEVIHGWGDVAAIAEAGVTHPWRAIQRGHETVIEPARGGPPVAWFPVGISNITTHRSGRLWAGEAHSQICLIRLVGDAESRMPRSATT